VSTHVFRVCGSGTPIAIDGPSPLADAFAVT